MCAVSVSNVIRLNDDILGNQIAPDIAVSSQGDVLVSYTDSELGLLGRTAEILASGNANLGPVENLVTDQGGNQASRNISFVDGNRFIFTHTADSRFTVEGFSYVIELGRVNQSGNIEILDYTGTADNVVGADILQVSEDASSNLGFTQLQRASFEYFPIDVSGSSISIGKTFILAQPPVQFAEYDSAYLGDGRAVLAYENGFGFDILSRVAEFDGNIPNGLGKEFIVEPDGSESGESASSGNQFNPMIASNGDGWVVYGYESNDPEISAFEDIAYRTGRVDGDQIELLVEGIVVPDLNFQHELIDIVNLPDGSFVFAFTETNAVAPERLVVRRGVVDTTGSIDFDEAVVVTEKTPTSSIAGFDVEVLPDGRLAVAYAKNAGEAGDFHGYGAYMRVVDFGIAESSGGAGGDAVVIDGLVLEGSNGPDTLTGSADNDSIDGLGGSDRLDGLGGSD